MEERSRLKSPVAAINGDNDNINEDEDEDEQGTVSIATPS